MRSASDLPSLYAGSRYVGGPLQSSQRCTTLAPYFAPPPVRSSPLYPFTSPNFALDFAGILSVNGKRQSVIVAGMSGQTGKRKEDVYGSRNDASWCDGR